MEKSLFFQSPGRQRVALSLASLLFLSVALCGCSKSDDSAKTSEPPAPADPSPATPSPSVKPLDAAGNNSSNTESTTKTPTTKAPTTENQNPADKPGPQANSPPVSPAHTQPAGDALLSGWPKPQVALLITGLQQGYLEPCGCTGLENQKGGLMRRHTLLRQLTDDRQWNVVPVDLGGMVRRSGRQAEIKYQRTIDVLKLMNYRAIGFGLKDLRLDTNELLAPVYDFETSTTPFISSNVRFYDLEDEETVPSFRVINAGGMKVGVTTVLGKSAQRQVTSSDILFKPALEALTETTARLTAADCDVLVLLAHATMDETKEFAKQFPQYDVVVTAGGATEPPRTAERLDSNGRILIEVGHKVLYAPVVGLYDVQGNDRLRYELVALDSRFKDSKAVAEVFTTYQEQLESAWKSGFDSLGIRPTPHPSGRKFVGSAACADCHSTAYDIWKKSPHAHATESLAHPPERTLPRIYDPECVSCHSTGWEPQQFQPYKSGFVDLKTTPLLAGSGCENCHGPGDRHAAAENGDTEADEAMLKQLRTEMQLPLSKALERCIVCHDLDNSPEFHKGDNFEKYWKKIEHVGKD